MTTGQLQGQEDAMPRVEKSITINVPVNVVYSMIADMPERMAEWWPPIESQERVSPPPTQVGSVSRYVYNMLGVKIAGEHQVQQLQRDEHLLVKTISGLDSTFDFKFEPLGDDETKLTIRVDYQLPGSIIGQILNKALIEGENVRNLEKGLENLKGILEEEHAG
jgi:uncharacterized membrane protein